MDLQIKKATLPANVEQLAARLKQKSTRFRDEVVRIILNKWEHDPELVRLLEAQEDEDAVNGSIAFDHFAASLRIQEVAITERNVLLGKLSPARIGKALTQAMKQLKIQRKGRPDLDEDEDHDEPGEAPTT